MRFRTLEIRWHDSKPISSCEFQPMPNFKKARPAGLLGNEERWASQCYRLATAGEDNHVRLWMVYPNLYPTSADGASEPNVSAAASTSTSRPPRVEYLATLSKHLAAVNVVRWSPNGEYIASAGDDGLILIWANHGAPPTTTYGSDLSPEELQNEKEFWRVRTTIQCTNMQIYDLAWSPTGDYIIAGSTDNTARIFTAPEGGQRVQEIAEHDHYVQGVSWDPLNEFIATQSSDRSMHVYRITTPTNSKQGAFEIHAVGKNTNINVNLSATGGVRAGRRHGRTSSTVSETHSVNRAGSRPRMFRRESTASDVESVMSDLPPSTTQEAAPPPLAIPLPLTGQQKDAAPLTPATSVASTPSMQPAASMFPPPPVDKDRQPSSRRSSFSGSNAPSSPAFSLSSRLRSPSPMPALPAIRTATPTSRTYPEERWKQVGLYGDESYTNFFRRLTFSPDGGLLVTPAGHFEDPEVNPNTLKSAGDEPGPSRGRKPKQSNETSDANSCVYIYTRANFARPPVAQLPGYRKASVAVKFSPILYEHRQGVLPVPPTPSKGDLDGAKSQETKSAVLEKGSEGHLDVNILGSSSSSSVAPTLEVRTPQRPASAGIAAPAPQAASGSGYALLSPQPASTATDAIRPPTPAASKPGTPIWAPSTPGPSAGGSLATGSVFSLPYRMLFAVVTMDAVAIYDTQQASPIAMLTKLHYDEFTDATWSPDGQCLLLSSRDGYCTLVMFDEILPAHHTQQQALQLQSIAHQHSIPTFLPTTPARASVDLATPSTTPAMPSVTIPVGRRAASGSSVVEPPTPASQDGEMTAPGGNSPSAFPRVDPAEKRPRAEDQTAEGEASSSEPQKKKRRVALTRVGDLDL